MSAESPCATILPFGNSLSIPFGTLPFGIQQWRMETETIQERRRARLRRWMTDNKLKQADLLSDIKKRTGAEQNQGELSGLLGSKSFAEKRARRLEKQCGMPPGYLDQAGDIPNVDGQAQDENDVRALTFVVRSLVTVLTANAPIAASAFAAVLREQAGEQKFDEGSGLIAQALRIVVQGQNIAASGVERALRRDSENQPKRERAGRKRQ